MMFRVFLTTGLLLFCSSAVPGEQTTDPSPKINFVDHVLPIFRQHCLTCHNANDAESGLAIDSYGGVMEGGGSGDAVVAGDASGSRLYAVMTHAEEPSMPPDQDPIPKEKLETIRQWIEGGLLENSGSKVKKRNGPSLSFSATDASGKPDEIAMPQSLWRVPVVTPERPAAASALATSPWAPLAAIAGQKQVVLYHTDSGELLGIIPYPDGIPQAIQFSRDGAYLLVAGGAHASKGVASLYDVKNGQHMLSVGDELDIVLGADINDNLSKIALGGPQRIVRIFDSATGEIVHELKKHTDWIFCVDYSPDGVLLASGDRSGGLHVWEADTGRLYLDLPGHKDAIRSLSWRADSNVLVSASEDGTVKLWEMNAGKQLKSFNAHGGGVTGVMMAKDGRIATSGKDKTVKLWKADGKAITTFPKFAEPALEVAINHDGTKIIGGDWTGTTTMWLIADPKQAQSLAANPPPLDVQTEALEKLVSERREALRVAESEKAKHESSLLRAKETHRDLQKKQTETAAKLASAKREKSDVQQQLARLQSEAATAKSQQATSREQADELRRTLELAQQQIKTLRGQIDAKVAKRDAVKQTESELAASIAVLDANVDDLKATAIESLVSITDRELDVAANERVAANAEADAQADVETVKTRIASLEQKLSEADGSTSSFRKALSDTRAEFDKLTDEVQRLAGTIKEGSQRVEEITADLAERKQQLADADDEAGRKMLEGKLADLRQDLKEAQSALDKAASERKEAEKNRELAKTRVEDLADKASTTSVDQASVESKLEKEREKLATLVATRDQLSSQRTAHGQKLTQIQNEVAAVTKLKDDAVKELAEIAEQRTDLDQQRLEISKAVKQEELSLNQTLMQLSELQKRVDMTQSALASAEHDAEKAAKMLASVDQRQPAIEKQIASLDATINQLNQASTTIRKRIAESQDKVTASEAALRTVEESVEKAMDQFAADQQRLDTLRAELLAFQKESERLEAEYLAAEKIAEEKRSAVEPEATRAEQTESSIAARSQQLEELKQSLEELQSRIAELQKKNASEKSELVSFQDRLTALQLEAEAAEEEAATRKEAAEFFRAAYGE